MEEYVELIIVEVPDERVNKLAAAFDSAKKIPAIVKFVDIAGLVRGANKGEGLGNQFLSHIRETNAIVEVLRCFKSAEIIGLMIPWNKEQIIRWVNETLEKNDKETELADQPEGY